MSGSSEARRAAVLGALAVLTIPIALIASALPSITVLHAVYVAVPVAFLPGLASLAAYRRARARIDRTVARTGEAAVRLARILCFLGLYIAVTGALALGVYGLLQLGL
jgi:hypothetical protein